MAFKPIISIPSLAVQTSFNDLIQYVAYSGNDRFIAMFQ